MKSRQETEKNKEIKKDNEKGNRKQRRARTAVTQLQSSYTRVLLGSGETLPIAR
jgi:hypothetical protein